MPIKVNKNALLKAKILDATRRALLAQRINHIGTQTENPYSTTIAVREQQTDIQKDLIGLEDKSMETEGAVTMRQECPGGCEYIEKKNLWHGILNFSVCCSYYNTDHRPNDGSDNIEGHSHANATAESEPEILIAEKEYGSVATAKAEIDVGGENVCE